jgi:hypothetical protein
MKLTAAALTTQTEAFKGKQMKYFPQLHVLLSLSGGISFANLLADVFALVRLSTLCGIINDSEIKFPKYYRASTAAPCEP